MRNLLALLLPLFCYACVTRGTEIVMPSGQKGWMSYCDTTKVKCYKQAGKTCPNGYDVHEENQMAQSSAKFGMGGGVASGKAQSDTRMTMIYTCKDAAVSH